jgi:hypothetical protein
MGSLGFEGKCLQVLTEMSCLRTPLANKPELPAHETPWQYRASVFASGWFALPETI